MNKEKINSISLCSMIIPLCCSTFYGIFSSFVLDTAKTDTFISMILGYIISIIISTIILKLFSFRTKECIQEKVIFAFGKISPIINTLIILLSMVIYIFISYRLVSFLSSQYLIRTNKNLIYALTLFITYNTAKRGIEVTTRVSTISVYISLFLYLFVLFGLFKEINFENFLPIITSNKKDILISSLIFSIYFTVPIFYINIVKKNDLVDSKKFNKYFYITHMFTFLLVFFAIMLTLGVYGINLSKIFDYPIYTVLYKIRISTFIDSVENILVIFWLLCSINASNIILLFIFNSINKSFNFKDKTKGILKYISLIIIFIIPTFLYQNNNYLESFDYIVIPFLIAATLILISFITFIILIIKKYIKSY